MQKNLYNGGHIGAAVVNFIAKILIAFCDVHLFP